MASCSTLRKSPLARFALGVVLFALAVLWPLFRQADDRPWDNVWAEDGRIFVQHANGKPLLETLFRGYAGYSHLLPRLLAVPTRYMPVEWIAAYIAIAGSVVTALVALFVYRASGSHITNGWARLAVAASCVLSPVLVLENEATIVNLYWIVTFATFWAIVTEQERWYDIVARALVVSIGTASSPIAVLFLPLVAVVAWLRRRRSDYIVAAAYLVGAAVQIIVVVACWEPTVRAPTKASDLVTIYAVRVLASAAIGERSTADLWVAWGPALTWVALAAAACIAVLVWRRRGPSVDRLALLALAYSLPLCFVPVLLRGSSLSTLVTGGYNQGGTRYFVTPVLLVVTAAACACAAARSSWWSKALLLQVVVVAALSVGVAGKWRPDGPSWIAGVRQGEVTCATTSDRRHAIPIAPLGPWWSWLPCDRFRD